MGLLDDIRGLLTPKPAVVPDPFDRQANAAIPIMGASEILPNMVGRMTGSPMAEFAAGFLSPSSWMKQPKKLDIFVGKGAKTWDADKAAKAADMEKAGVDRATIWKETGTWKGPDKQWRQEIPDNEITLKNIPIAKDWETFFKEKEINKYGRRGAQVSEMKGDSFSAFKKFRADAEKEFNDHNKTHRNINEILHHEALINSYPELEKTSVMWNPNIGKSGEYSRGTISFGDATNESGLKSLFGHELQHAVQQREGFARGGSPEAMRSFLAPDPSLQSAYSQSELNDAYRRLAGEAEARLTQSRMPMTMEERLATPPWTMFDVPEAQQIVRFGDGAQSLLKQNTLLGY